MFYQNKHKLPLLELHPGFEFSFQVLQLNIHQPESSNKNTKKKNLNTKYATLDFC